MSRVVTIDGEPIVDGARKLTVHISSRDTKRGQTKSPASCAAALACKREVPKCTQARVHISRTYLKINGKWVRYATPPALRSEIVAFDRGAPFAPGTYALAPLKASSRVRKRQGSDKPKKRNGKKRRAYHMVSGVRHFGAVG